MSFKTVIIVCFLYSPFINNSQLRIVCGLSEGKRDSKKFKKKYKMRIEVERLNGRIDRDYMFNDHFIRGQKKNI